MTLHVWDGISVFRTLLQAQGKARDYPFLGAYIAQIDLDVDIPTVRVEKTFGRGHFTVLGDPAALLRLVVSITPAH
jgi:hypothetical protein